MEGSGGITTLTKKETAHYLLAAKNPVVVPADVNTISRTINGRYNASIISRYVGLAIEDFQKMNPDFENMVATTGKYEMKLPAEKMETFTARKMEILRESIQLLLNADTPVSTSR
jgi:membrane-bound lytic murein transglycosylase D